MKSVKPKSENALPSESSQMFRRILAVVRRIPHAKVATYGQVAKVAGFEGAARQVAWALHSSNGLCWHRVVGAKGKILLPGELGREQRLRLELEGVTFSRDRVRMDLYQVRWKKQANKSCDRATGSRPARQERGIGNSAI